MRMWWLIFVVMAGCSLPAPSDDRGCTPGEQVGCACPGTDSVRGTQTCNREGTGFGVCTGCPDYAASGVSGDRWDWRNSSSSGSGPAVSWAGLGLESRAVRSLAVSPTEPARMFAGTDSGVLRTGDGGTTWDFIPDMRGTVFFAAGRLWHLDDGLRHSSDHGATWTGVPPPGEAAWTSGERGLKVLASGRILAWLTDFTAGHTVAWSDDDGTTWTAIGEPDEPVFSPTFITGDDEGRVFVASYDGIHRHTGGTTWELFNHGLEDLDFRAGLLSTESPPALLAVNAQGLVRSPSGEAHWTLVSDALRDGPLLDVAWPAASNPGRRALLGGGSFAESIIKLSLDGGQTFVGLGSRDGTPHTLLAALVVDGKLHVYATAGSRGVLRTIVE